MAKPERESELGRTLKELRAHQGISQATLADRTDGLVSDGHIAQIETGRRSASDDTLRALAEAFTVADDRESIEYLTELVAAATVDRSRVAVRKQMRAIEAAEPSSHERRPAARGTLGRLTDEQIAKLEEIADVIFPPE